MISAIVEANRTRKDVVAEMILKRKPKLVGVYRLTMKSGSDNFRSSAVFGIIKRLRLAGVPIIAYEPTLTAMEYYETPIENNFDKFKSSCDLILANRIDETLGDVEDKIISRDIFFNN